MWFHLPSIPTGPAETARGRSRRCRLDRSAADRDDSDPSPHSSRSGRQTVHPAAGRRLPQQPIQPRRRSLLWASRLPLAGQWSHAVEKVRSGCSVAIGMTRPTLASSAVFGKCPTRCGAACRSLRPPSGRGLSYCISHRSSLASRRTPCVARTSRSRSPPATTSPTFKPRLGTANPRPTLAIYAQLMARQDRDAPRAEVRQLLGVAEPRHEITRATARLRWAVPDSNRRPPGCKERARVR